MKTLQPILPENPIIAPVPLHWTRLLRRKYNQSELLSQSLARIGKFEHAPSLLKRTKRTPPLFDSIEKSVNSGFKMQSASIPKWNFKREAATSYL